MLRAIYAIYIRTLQFSGNKLGEFCRKILLLQCFPFGTGVAIRLLTLAITRKWSESILAPLYVRTSKTFEACLASIAIWSIWFFVLWSGEDQVALCIFRCEKKVLEMTTPLLVAQSASRLPLSVGVSCRLCLPTDAELTLSLPTSH